MGLFKKENIQNFFWGIILTIVGFGGSQLWNYFDGPQKVFVTNVSGKTKDTSITLIKIEGDTTFIKYLKNSGNLNFNATSKSDETQNTLVTINDNKLKFPKIVEGYTQNSLNSFCVVSIPRFTYTKNEILQLGLKFFNNNSVAKISPIMISIMRRENKNAYDLLWEQQFTVKGINNTVQLPTNFNVGTYDLIIGFYLMDELNQKFPPFYSKTITITV